MRCTRRRSIFCAPRTDQYTAQKPIYNVQYCVYKSVCVCGRRVSLYIYMRTKCAYRYPRARTTRRARGELYAAPLYARLAIVRMHIDEIFAALELRLNLVISSTRIRYNKREYRSTRLSVYLSQSSAPNEELRTSRSARKTSYMYTARAESRGQTQTSKRAEQS
ncbi:unnamed protein product [Trichogramma brassicae]|uniref:Uncharacterized protein n=1 Tax=Trichogramma brassicae TaxID=86971 RepID=A0A6H5IWB6_9HYME|nr:unnamed protein product [Trichogramma brassicae]